MALTSEIGATEAAVMIPEIWGPRINDFFKCRQPLADFFTNRSSELAMGGDILHTPNLTEMTANTKSNGSDVTLNAPTETKIDLTVNQWKEVSFLIEDKELAQILHSYSIMEAYAKNAGYTVAGALETAIAALFSAFSTTYGASSTNIADSDILAGIATLEGVCADVYSGDVAFIMHPNTWYRQVAAINKFSLATNAPVNDPVSKKPMASLYGIPVIVSNDVPSVLGSRQNMIVHRDAIHWATSPIGAGGSKGAFMGDSGIRVQANYWAEQLGTLVTADILYGVVENRDNAGVVLKSHATAA